MDNTAQDNAPKEAVNEKKAHEPTPEKPVDNRCANCSGFVPNPADLQQGVCIMLPPQIFVVPDGKGGLAVRSMHPPVPASISCLQHQRRPGMEFPG